ncbi:hypothetical protein [Streptomyces sirii]
MIITTELGPWPDQITPFHNSLEAELSLDETLAVSCIQQCVD